LDKAWSSDGWKMACAFSRALCAQIVPRDGFLPHAIHMDAD
jgi:hypothetical protein